MDEEEAKALRQRLRDRDPQNRVEAVKQLAEDGDDSVIPFVYGALEDRNLEVRCAALRTLMTLRPGVALLTAIDKAASFDAGERRAAVELLRDNPDARAIVRLHGVAGNEDEDGEVRAMALEAMGRIGDDRSLPVVMELIEADDPPVRIAALQILRSLPFEATDAGNGHMEVARQLGAALTETTDSPAVHAEIARTLGAVAGWFALPRLLELMDDEREEIRAAAVDGVSVVEGATTHEELPNSLLRLLNHEKSPLVRTALARAVALLKLKDGISRVVEYLQDDDGNVRLAAVETLTQLGVSEALDEIEELREDDSQQVQEAVKRAVEKLGDQEEEEGDEE